MSRALANSEDWVKGRVREMFVEYGIKRPYMPPPAIYGAAGGADFIECFHGYYLAVETKRLGKKQTKTQEFFMERVRAQGGTYLLVYENNLNELRDWLAYVEQYRDVPIPR
jgi:hypothetical protein